MVDAYGGFVRCGGCDYKFNIHDQLPRPEEDPEIDVFDRDKAMFETGNADFPKRKEPDLHSREEPDPHNIRLQDLADDDEEAFEPSLDGDGQISIDIKQLFDHRDKEIDGWDDNEELSFANVDEPSIDPEFDLASWEEVEKLEPSLTPEDEKIRFDQGLDSHGFDAETDHSLISEDIDEEDPNKPSLFFSAIAYLLTLLFWTVLTLGLAYLLFGQIKDKLYPAYQHTPVVQSLRASVCKYLPCEDKGANLDLFEVVVSRMDEVVSPSRQFHISIFLLNKAQISQAYPNILITLNHLDGSIAGQRVISPNEYFTTQNSLVNSGELPEQAAKKSIPAGKLGKILIKFDQPPKNAVGFKAQVVR